MVDSGTKNGAGGGSEHSPVSVDLCLPRRIKNYIWQQNVFSLAIQSTRCMLTINVASIFRSIVHIPVGAPGINCATHATGGLGVVCVSAFRSGDPALNLLG